MNITVCALYHFVPLPDFKALQQPLLALMDDQGIRGTLLLAREGINGTVAGSDDAVQTLLTYLRAVPGLADLKTKLSYDTEIPFYRAKVRLKKEIVTMGVADIDPRHSAGTYIAPAEWNQLIQDPDVTVIDTRNEYEVQIGSFNGSENPHTKSFREFPGYVKENLDPAKHKKVAMFCTGGIRCEKSTAYLKSQGFDEVYHLQGGILKYLEEVPESESLWHGECFVFDNRVTVNHSLERGSYEQCHACRMPITPIDMESNAYVEGVSCPHCIEVHSEAQRERFREREKQIRLSKHRGEEHIGTEARRAQDKHKAQKDEAQKNQARQQKRVNEQQNRGD